MSMSSYNLYALLWFLSLFLNWIDIAHVLLACFKWNTYHVFQLSQLHIMTYCMSEAHGAQYSIHPGYTKIYRDFREAYWWNNMRKDIARFMAKYSNCQQVKVQHQISRGLAQDIKIPPWKWEDVNVNFIIGLPHTHVKHDSIWVVIDRMTKSMYFLLVKTSYFIDDYAKMYVYLRISKVLWCFLVHYFELWYLIRLTVLKIRSKGSWYMGQLKHQFSPSKRWSSQKNNSKFREYVEGIYNWLQEKFGWSSTIDLSLL